MPLNRDVRTDLASERLEFARTAAEITELPGVISREEQQNGFRVTSVEILDERGSELLCKPIGHYYTVDLEALIRRQENAFEDAAELLAELLRSLLSEAMDGGVLVAGLGNKAITPDAIGPLSVESVMATRHLKEKLPEDFAAFREVSAIATGVLGTTGIESAEVLRAVAKATSPASIIAVDALASASLDRLCRSVQLSNAGIVPGSGVGNDREELSAATFGIPVIAVGVPTVVDAAVFSDMPEAKGMFVTPRNIDSSVQDCSKLIGYSIDLALHDGLTIGDIDMFLS